MASALTLSAREQDSATCLPVARHVTDTVLALDSGALTLSLQLEGASFETADMRDLNDWHQRLNGAWRNLASERLALWHHLVRREDDRYPQGDFRSDFARDLDRQYQGRIRGQRMFVNELYLTLVLRPGQDRARPGQTLLEQIAGPQRQEASEADDLRILQDAARDLQQYLARYAPKALGLYQRGGLQFSRSLELLRLILSGRPEPVPLVRGHLGSALYVDRLIFGREALEIRGAADQRYAAMFGIKEYPAATRPGLWDGLLSAPFALVATQSFAFLSKDAARTVLERKQNQMLSARDRAASQIDSLDLALDDLLSNRFVMGEHQASVLVHGAQPAILADNMARARAILADSGLVAAREDLGLEAAFWAQFPGNFRYRVRPAAINSLNFAGLASFHTYPAGRAEGSHWGPAAALLRTAAGSPFHFNFHVGDVGHTFICGPTGAGKTVVQNFLLAQLEKFGAQQVFIDKDRGAEIFVRACGGRYLSLKPGEPTGFSPFRALPDTPGDRAFLSGLVRRMVARPGHDLSPQESAAIDAAVAALAPLAPAQRSISALRSLLGQGDAGGIGARLERWARGGPLAWVFDNSHDALDLGSRFVGLDITHLLDMSEVRTPVMMYLVHRLQSLIDGRRLVVDIDEFWKALGDEAFRALAQDGLKTYRKQNAFMVFGTQSPADVLGSPIAHTILEQCATKIFLPNPHAAERDYVEGFGLSRREFDLVRAGMIPERRQFLIKQGLNSVVAELDLSGLDDALAILSGRAETVAVLDAVRARHGDDPADWIPHFHQSRRSS